MKHSIEEVHLKNGARGLLIDAPGSAVINIKMIFRAGNKFVKKPEIYEVAHLMEHMAFGRNGSCSSGYIDTTFCNYLYVH